MTKEDKVRLMQVVVILFVLIWFLISAQDTQTTVKSGQYVNLAKKVGENITVSFQSTSADVDFGSTEYFVLRGSDDQTLAPIKQKNVPLGIDSEQYYVITSLPISSTKSFVLVKGDQVSLVATSEIKVTVSLAKPWWSVCRTYIGYGIIVALICAVFCSMIWNYPSPSGKS